MSWKQSLSHLKDIQLELLRLAPYRDTGLIPNPGASEESLQESETRLGQALPVSYRDFLKAHDGWPRFFDGASLLGASELGDPRHQEVAATLLRHARTASASSPCLLAPVKREYLVFGIDAMGTSLFAFETTARREDGEMPVVAWIDEIGIRCRSFEDFLLTLLDLCGNEWAEYREPASGAAQSTAQSTARSTTRTAPAAAAARRSA
jgi:hypothetical protein